MVDTFLNHVAIAAPRNGTITHSVTPSSGTVVAGTLFTPTAGRLLVALTSGSVSSTIPANWTLPTNGLALGNSGLYVWVKTAVGSDTLSTDHNGANYPVVFDFYEFPAGTVFLGAESGAGVANGSPGPTLVNLNNPPVWIAGAASQGVSSSGITATWTWDAGTEATDTFISAGDGYSYSLTYLAGSALTSKQFTATSTYNSTSEQLVFAVRTPQPNVTPTANAGADQTVEPNATVTLAGMGSDSDGTIASYAWTQTGGPAVTLTGTGANRTFTAPSVSGGTMLTFSLTVTDNSGATSPADTMTVTVLTPTEFYASGGIWVPLPTISL